MRGYYSLVHQRQTHLQEVKADLGKNMEPGPRNLITDVDGIFIGNAENHAARTGTTVVLPDNPVTAAVDVRGGAPGTRETDVLDPENLVDDCHAVILSGGSAFGLDAAAGAMAWLAERKRGFRFGDSIIPVVPAAILFDMNNGGNKDWGRYPPYRELGYEACNNADKEFDLGNSGAGLGASAGRLKGGLGSASIFFEDGIQVGAIVAVNPGGAVVMPGTDTLWAWPFELDNEMGSQRPPAEGELDLAADYPGNLTSRLNTTLGVVATNAKITPAQGERIASMAQDGLARAIRPIHTPFDGDIVFAIGTGTIPLADPAPRTLMRIGAAAADCVARSIGRAVFEAKKIGDRPAYRDVHASGFASGSENAS